MGYFDFYTEELTPEQRHELNGLMSIHENAGMPPYQAAMQVVRDKLADARERKAELDKLILESSGSRSASFVPTFTRLGILGMNTVSKLQRMGYEPATTVISANIGETRYLTDGNAATSSRIPTEDLPYLNRTIEQPAEVLPGSGRDRIILVGNAGSRQFVTFAEIVVGADSNLLHLFGKLKLASATRYLADFRHNRNILWNGGELDGAGDDAAGETETVVGDDGEGVNQALQPTDSAVKPILESSYDWRAALDAATTIEDINAMWARLFPGKTYPKGVNADVVRRMENKVAILTDKVSMLTDSMNRLAEQSKNIPGVYITGGSNYHPSLKRLRESHNNKQSANFTELLAAQADLKHAKSLLAGYVSGERHENGQPRADSPSRKEAASAAELYAEYIRDRVKPGDKVTFLPNPSPSGVVVSKLNKKTVALASGSVWDYLSIMPWIDGKEISQKEMRADFKEWKNKNHVTESALLLAEGEADSDVKPILESSYDHLCR